MHGKWVQLSILRICLHHFLSPLQLTFHTVAWTIHLCQNLVHVTLLLKFLVSVIFSRTWVKSVSKVLPWFWSLLVYPLYSLITSPSPPNTPSGLGPWLTSGQARDICEGYTLRPDLCPLSSAHIFPHNMKLNVTEKFKWLLNSLYITKL